MARLHFKSLESHRIPVLHLYKSLIRLSLHLPVSKDYKSLIHSQIITKFKDGKKHMSPKTVKELLTKARLWNDKMYNAIKHDYENRIMPNKDGVASLIAEDVDFQTSPCLKWINVQIKNHQALLKQKEEQQKANEKLKQTQELDKTQIERQKLQSWNALYKHKLIMAYRKSGRLATNIPKAELDHTYIECILLPDYLKNQEMIKLGRRRKLQLSRPLTAKLAYTGVPTGKFFFLRYPWKRQNKILSQMIHKAIHSDLQARIEQLEELKVLANYEYAWEENLKSSTDFKSLEKNGPQHGWVAPINDSINSLKLLHNAREAKNNAHLRVLLRNKRLIDISFSRKYEKTIAKWKAYSRDRKSNPKKYMTHYADLKKLYSL